MLMESSLFLGIPFYQLLGGVEHPSICLLNESVILALNARLSGNRMAIRTHFS